MDTLEKTTSDLEVDITSILTVQARATAIVEEFKGNASGFVNMFKDYHDGVSSFDTSCDNSTRHCNGIFFMMREQIFVGANISSASIASLIVRRVVTNRCSLHSPHYVESLQPASVMGLIYVTTRMIAEDETLCALMDMCENTFMSTTSKQITERSTRTKETIRELSVVFETGLRNMLNMRDPTVTFEAGDIKVSISDDGENILVEPGKKWLAIYNSFENHNCVTNVDYSYDVTKSVVCLNDMMFDILTVDRVLSYLREDRLYLGRSKLVVNKFNIPFPLMYRIPSIETRIAVYEKENPDFVDGLGYNFMDHVKLKLSHLVG